MGRVGALELTTGVETPPIRRRGDVFDRSAQGIRAVYGSLGPVQDLDALQIEGVDIEGLEREAERGAGPHRHLVEIHADRAAQLRPAGGDAANGDEVAGRARGFEAESGDIAGKALETRRMRCAESRPGDRRHRAGDVLQILAALRG